MIRCDSIDADVLPYSPHMCLKVGHICATKSRLACTTSVLVRCEDCLPFAAYGVQERNEIAHQRTGAPDSEMGTFPLKKTASPANLILHVKNVCFLVSAFFQGR